MMVVGASLELEGNDIFGIGKVVDEASEIIDSLDRPIVSIQHYKRNKKTKDYTRFQFNISKLDILLFVFMLAAFYIAMKIHFGLPTAGITRFKTEMQTIRTDYFPSFIRQAPLLDAAGKNYNVPGLGGGGGGIGDIGSVFKPPSAGEAIAQIVSPGLAVADKLGLIK